LVKAAGVKLFQESAVHDAAGKYTKQCTVYGIDGVTYWCGCLDAACAGTKVTKLGYCEVGNGSGEPGPISGHALILVQIIWLIVLGFSVLFGLL
jgi:hypothetical protein